MMTWPETSAEQCPRCGDELGDHAADGFCSRCAATVSFAETEPELASEEELAALLPRTALAGATGAGFGDYELIEEIARGGMGVVYRARQRSLNRTVAIKMLLFGGLAGPEATTRFRTEAAAASALEHPNIVRILDVGEQAGQPFLAMEHVAGRDLARWVSERPLAPRQAAGYVEKIARAVEFAHQRGVLHRDLKPSNVLVDAFDEPRVTDFGLARYRAEDSDLTRTGQTLGSANFMPPEQAAGEVHRIGPASDVYGVGAILYHLVTGRPPFLADSFEATLRQVLERDPVAPRQFNPNVPADLETICLKCLEKEPAKRYASAQALADDLGSFLRDEPILARPIGVAGKAWRWCRRKPVIASLAATSVVLLLAVAIGGPIAAYRINQERMAANQERLLTRQGKYASDMRLASEAVREGQFNHARELLRGHEPKPGEEDLRGLEWRYLAHEVQASEPVRTLAGLPASSHWEDTLLFRADHFLYNQSGDQLNQLKAWDMNTWEPVQLSPPAQPPSVSWQFDPARGAAYAVDQNHDAVTVYALPKFQARAVLRLPGPVSPVVAMSPDRQQVAVGFREGTAHRLLVWDLARDARVGVLGDVAANISVLAFSPDGTRLAASSTTGVIGIWNLQTFEPLPAPPSPVDHVARLVFTPDNRRLLFGGYTDWGGWDIQSGGPVALKRGAQHAVAVQGISPDGQYLVMSWGGRELTLHDPANFLVLGTLPRSPLSPVRKGGLKFSPDGTLMASSSDEQTAGIWDLTTRMEVGIVGGFGQRICDVEFTADSQNIVVIGLFGEIRSYRLSRVLSRGRLAHPPKREEQLIDLAISPDERRLATVGPDGTLALRDRQGRRLIRPVNFPRYAPESYPRVVFSPAGERVYWVTGDALRSMAIASEEVSSIPLDGNREANAIAFAPNGRELAFGCGSQVMLCDLASGPPHRFATTEDEVFAIAYSPDGALLAFGCRGGGLTVCARSSGRVLWKDEPHRPALYGVAFSPDGRLLATSGADSTIQLWQVRSNGALHVPPRTLRGHRGYVNLLAFSPDGTRLVTPSADETLKIWDPHRGAELATLYGHHGLVGRASFTKDGCTIYSAGLDGEIRCWEAPPLPELELSTNSTSLHTRPVQAKEPR